MKFYAVIIGTEILNGRREDKHFTFLKAELAKYGHELFASFIIKDDIELMSSIYRLIKKDRESILFSFGGIGSTPDDLTREVASEVFRSLHVEPHKEFTKNIIEKFKEDAYPHRIKMAHLPPNSSLLKNPINNMSGFSLDDRFFFVPGFPIMAHPMISEVIATRFSKRTEIFRYTLLAQTSENTLITTMKKVPLHVELSSLPIFKHNNPSVELSLSSRVDKDAKEIFELFIDELKTLNIDYKIY